MLSFFRAGAKLPGRPLRGTSTEDQSPVEVRWGGGGAAPAKPHVSIRQEGGQVTVRFAGTPEQFKKVHRDLTKRYGSSFPDFETSLKMGERVKEPSPRVQIPLQAEMGRLNRFAAKIALGGGAAIWGDQFTDSEIAAELRSILQAPDGKFEWERTEIPFEFAKAMMGSANEVGRFSLPDISPSAAKVGERVSQLTFVPIRHPQFPQPTTALFVELLGFPLLQGLPLPGALPEDPILPVVVREVVGKRFHIWRMDELFFGGIEDRYGED